MALKPLKPSKAKRKDKHSRSLDQQAQQWVFRWRLEESRRRQMEQRLGSVSWRYDPDLDPQLLEPSLRQKVLSLLD